MRVGKIARLVIVVCLVSLIGSARAVGQGQDGKPEPRPLSEAILSRVPGDYREEAKKYITATDEVQQRLVKQSDSRLALWIVRGLAREPEAADFLVAELEKESSAALRSAIIDSLRRYWVLHPEAQSILMHHAASDPDVDVSIAALDVLRALRMRELGKLLETRLEAARRNGDAGAMTRLAPEEEHWFCLEGGTTLPAFMRVPPPLFVVKPADQPIRVLAFGDFGTGSPGQINTAKAMVEYNKSHPFDFGLTLGDNFYPAGMVSPSDPRWQTQWEQLYGPLGIKFYATLGNHDWASEDSPAAEVLYANQSPDWRLPAPYYTFSAGPVQFFAVDTVELNEAELIWLDRELAKSTARWRLVYGHYHIYSATRGDNQVLIERLLPVLKKNHVDVYLNGHDHNLQELKPDGGVHFFVSGGGGASLYDLKPYEHSVFKQKENGFTVIEADAHNLKVSFIGMDGRELHTTTLQR